CSPRRAGRRGRTASCRRAASAFRCRGGPPGGATRRTARSPRRCRPCSRRSGSRPRCSSWSGPPCSPSFAPPRSRTTCSRWAGGRRTPTPTTRCTRSSTASRSRPPAGTRLATPTRRSTPSWSRRAAASTRPSARSSTARPRTSWPGRSCGAGSTTPRRSWCPGPPSRASPSTPSSTTSGSERCGSTSSVAAVLTFVARRLLLAVPVLLGVVFVVMLTVELIPGDAVALMLGEHATPEAVARLRDYLGLDKPLLVRYTAYVGRVARGDLGRSIQQNRPVVAELADGWPATLQLTAAALLLAGAAGVAAGVISAVWPNSLFDAVARVGSLFGLSMPVFWTGLVLIVIFALWLPWLPVGGGGSPTHPLLAGAPAAP